MNVQHSISSFAKMPAAGLAATAILLLALVSTTPAQAGGGTLHVVELVGVDFVPENVDVEPGDTIRWIRSAGTHSVTSGPDCEYDELYFDEPMNEESPIFEWEVPADLTGVLDYFCRPHCAVFGMEGTITVDTIGQRCESDVDMSGAVDFVDLLTLLGQWGPCPGCSSDIDGNDVVDFQDLLSMLASWGPCP